MPGRLLTPALAPLSEGLPLVAGGHVEHVSNYGKALGTGGEGPGGFLGEEAAQKNGSHQDGNGVQEGRRVGHGVWMGPGAEDGRQVPRGLGTFKLDRLPRTRDLQERGRLAHLESAKRSSQATNAGERRFEEKRSPSFVLAENGKRRPSRR